MGELDSVKKALKTSNEKTCQMKTEFDKKLKTLSIHAMVINFTIERNKGLSFLLFHKERGLEERRALEETERRKGRSQQ